MSGRLPRRVMDAELVKGGDVRLQKPILTED
jgi:hypothetical protein